MINPITFQELLNIENFRDSEQRPLGEYKAGEQAKMGVNFKLKKCPYNDTRLKHEYPMNTSALQQIMSYWEESMAAFQHLRKRYSHYRGISLDRIIDNFHFCQAIINLPSWLLKRAKNPFSDGSLPPVIAVMYKITIGLHRVLQVFISGKMMMTDIESSMQVNAVDMLTYSDLGGFLIGTQEVCAGPPKYIEQAINTILFDLPSFSKTDNILDLLIENYEDYFAFSDSIARVTSADYSLRILSFFTLNEMIKIIPNVSKHEFQTQIDAFIAKFDNVSTLQNYLNTRSELQHNKLVFGWLKIACTYGCKAALKFPNECIFHKDIRDLQKQFDEYLHFEKFVLQVFDMEEKQFNKLLGYESSVKTTGILRLRLEISDHLINLFECLTVKRI